MPLFSRLKPRSLADVESAIRDAVYTPLGDLDVTAWVTPEPVAFADRRAGREVRLRPGDR
jgi:alpha-mannosidase